MLKYRGAQPDQGRFIGAVLIVLVIAVGLQPERLLSMATAVRYQALFSEAGGLAVGQRRHGVGDQGRHGVGCVAAARRCPGDVHVKGKILLGSATTAHIQTGTLLGERVLTLESAGSGTMHPMAVIPVSRTSSPYSLTEAVSDFTTNTAETRHRDR